jgi:hypothetical protein
MPLQEHLKKSIEELQAQLEEEEGRNDGLKAKPRASPGTNGGGLHRSPRFLQFFFFFAFFVYIYIHIIQILWVPKYIGYFLSIWAIVSGSS